MHGFIGFLRGAGVDVACVLDAVVGVKIESDVEGVNASAVVTGIPVGAAVR